MNTKVPENVEKYSLYSSESDLWSKIKSVAKKAGVKVIYAALLLYYVLPIDLIPDVIPVVGYSDDLAAILWALHAVWSNVTPEIKAKAMYKLQEWFGDVDEVILDIQ